MEKDRIYIKPGMFSIKDKIIGLVIIGIAFLVSAFLWLSALGIIK